MTTATCVTFGGRERCDAGGLHAVPVRAVDGHAYSFEGDPCRKCGRMVVMG